MARSPLTQFALQSLILFVICASAWAQETHNWKEPISGSWNDPTRWDTGSVPDSADFAVITLDGTYTVTINGFVQVNAITLGGSSGTLTVSAANTTIATNGIDTNENVILAFDNVSLTGNCDFCSLFPITNRATMDLHNSFINFDIVNEDTVLIRGDDNYILGFIRNKPGGTVTVQGHVCCGNGRIEIDLGFDFINPELGRSFVNEGILELTSNDPAYVSSVDMGGDLLNSGVVSIAEDDTLLVTGLFENRSSGILQGTGSLDISMGINEGEINPGQSVGTLSLIGDISQTAGGELNVELMGTDPVTDYDRLLVNGDMVLGGALNVNLLNGFFPAVDDLFTVLEYDSLTGTFDLLNGIWVNEDLALVPMYGDTALTLVATLNPVGIAPGNPVASSVVFYPARPNPFRGATYLSFYLPLRMPVRVTVHDGLGRSIVELADGTLGPGRQVLIWNAGDGHGATVPAGVYFARLQTGEDVISERIVHVK